LYPFLLLMLCNSPVLLNYLEWYWLESWLAHWPSDLKIFVVVTLPADKFWCTVLFCQKWFLHPLSLNSGTAVTLDRSTMLALSTALSYQSYCELVTGVELRHGISWAKMRIICVYK
jgi:hypothetical protein